MAAPYEEKREHELVHAQTKDSEAAYGPSEKPVPIVEQVDYSGAHEKTDPKEIKLVRKLDRWIMVHCSLPVLYLASISDC